MKKFGICLVLVFLVVGTSCFAQNNNDAQRIVGTWVGKDRFSSYTTYTFNSNGTYTVENIRNGRYFISSGKIFFDSAPSYDYFLSSDGKILVLKSTDSDMVLWLDKK